MATCAWQRDRDKVRIESCGTYKKQNLFQSARRIGEIHICHTQRMRGRYTGSINNVRLRFWISTRTQRSRTHKETPKLTCGGVDGKFTTFLTRLPAPQTPRYFKTRTDTNRGKMKRGNGVCLGKINKFAARESFYNKIACQTLRTFFLSIDDPLEI
jgi:hypothetical protein